MLLPPPICKIKGAEKVQIISSFMFIFLCVINMHNKIYHFNHFLSVQLSCIKYIHM